MPPDPLWTTRVRLVFNSQTIGSFSNFYSWQLYSQLTYRGPQYLFGKISTSLINTISIERTTMIFNTNYALSKWLHLHRASVMSGCIFFLASCKRSKIIQMIPNKSTKNYSKILNGELNSGLLGESPVSYPIDHHDILCLL